MRTQNADAISVDQNRSRAILEALFEAHYDAVMRYVRRRTAQPADAEEIVAEAFVIAWRRIDDAPAPEERLYWLYGIARRVLANHRRGLARRVRLHTKLREALSGPRHSSSALPEVLVAMEALNATDQEILRLTAWEGLPHVEIAAVLGITPNAAAIRLHRARGRLRRALDDRIPRPAKGLRRFRTFVGWKGSESRRSPQEEAP